MVLVDGTVGMLYVPSIHLGLPKTTGGVFRIPLTNLLLVVVVVHGNIEVLPLRSSLENNNVFGWTWEIA